MGWKMEAVDTIESSVDGFPAFPTYLLIEKGRRLLISPPTHSLLSFLVGWSKECGNEGRWTIEIKRFNS